MTSVPAAVLEAALDAAASLSGMAPAEISVLRAEVVTWPDGGLGCPEPGVMYAQVLVAGYWVVVNAGDRSYDLRASLDTQFKLCPAGDGTPPVPDPDIY